MSSQAAKLFSAVLAGLCGILLLLALAMQLGFGRGYSWLPVEIESSGTIRAKIDRTAFSLPPETEFAATSERPVFNEDRKPTPDSPDEPDVPPPPKVPLNIALTGIILTPDLRMAMVHDKAKNHDVALREGMPMEGDQGGWVLTKINARSAIFREASGDEVEVELSTAVASPNPAASRGNAAHVARSRGSAAPSLAQAQKNSQAAALQKRIEERRAQMREEAERLRRERAEHTQ
jgi:general secretion pathway protein N